jgi:membrane-associated protein
VKTFLFYNFIGTVPKSLAFLLIGYYFGRAYREIDRYFDYTAVALFIIMVLAAAAYIFAKRLRNDIK